MPSLKSTRYPLSDPLRALFNGGSGQYQLPVHLEGLGTEMLDLGMIIEQQQPDVNGNVIPPATREGSLVLANPKGDTEPLNLNLSHPCSSETALPAARMTSLALRRELVLP